MNKNQEIIQIKYYCDLLKSNGLNMKLWDLIDRIESSLIEKIILESEDK